MAQTLKFGNGTWATKKDSILAYNDENENYKPLPFNYTGAGKGTRVNKEGLIEVVENDRPRIDYLDSEDGVFLLEKAATNLITSSQGSVPTLVNVTQIINNSISPDGNNNSTLITSNATSAAHYFGFSVASVTSGISYTGSIFVKKGTGRFFQLLYGSGGFSTTKYMTFDLESGIIVYNGENASGTIEAIGKNGWYRLSITATANSTTTETLYCGIVTSGTSTRLESHTSILTYSIYGSQLEAGNLSSYIPTQGTIQTRVQETASGSGNSEVFNDSEGVLFADIAAWADDGTFRKISLNSGSPLQSLVIYYRNTSNAIEIEFSSGAFYQHLLTDSTISTKVSVKYKENDTDIYINGFLVHTITSVAMPVGLSKLDFYNNNTQHFYGKVKEISYYDEILTDLELETLTSYRNWESMVNELNLNVIYNG
jgi:hypothetical protein